MKKKTHYSCKRKGGGAGGGGVLERGNKIIQIARTGVAVTCCPVVPPSWENHSIFCFSGFHKSASAVRRLALDSVSASVPPSHRELDFHQIPLWQIVFRAFTLACSQNATTERVSLRLAFIN